MIDFSRVCQRVGDETKEAGLLVDRMSGVCVCAYVCVRVCEQFSLEVKDRGVICMLVDFF